MLLYAVAPRLWMSASGDDNNPVLKLWDLRSSTTVPLATLAGHTEGILSVAWCPYGEGKRGDHGVWRAIFCGGEGQAKE